jgi:glycosidase
VSRQPLLYEVFARSWLAETGARSLADIPDAELDRLAALGFDHVWVMGVWTLGEVGRAIARHYFPDAPDVVGSPYAIARYAVSPSFGGDSALAALRQRLAERGIRLILDFVPNHTARDHHWIKDSPELFVRDPKTGAIAEGKDPYFPSWTDTAQLDHRLAATRARLIETLLAIADRCDGVRCDMSMLVLSDVFAKTWANAPTIGAPATGEFWADAIHALRTRHPDFTLIAEAYWNLEPRLQRLGFDFTYDKALYDLLLHKDAAALRDHLAMDLEDHARSVRFLENHDEPRLAHELPALPRRAAAMVLAYTLPGMRFFHDGQIEGRREHATIQLARRPAEPADAASIALHEQLFAILRLPALRDGAFRLLRGSGGIVAHRWEHRRGSVIVAVNYSDATVHAQFPVELHGVEGRQVVLRDRLTGTDYARDGTQLVDPQQGLHVVLAPWQAHVFEVH